MLKRGMEQLKLEEGDLTKLGKGALEKLALAWWVSQKTIVSRRWLSQRLAMGDESRITQAIRTVKAIRNGRLLRMRCKLSATADGMT